MTAYEQARLLVPRLSTLERLRLSEELASQSGASAGRGIALTPGVCGGSARVEGTRIPVWLLEELRRMGATEAELLESYPTITAEDLRRAWEYAAAHEAEIEEEIRQNNEDE